MSLSQLKSVAALWLLTVGCAAQPEVVRQEAPAAVSDAAAALPTAPPEKPMSDSSQVPPTRTQVVRETFFGTAVSDPFRWLEDEKSPEVQAWMKAQDGYTRARLARLPAREALLKRYTELYYLDAVGVPFKRGGRTFYSRQTKEKEKAFVVWRLGELPEKVLLDPNAWSTDNTVSLGTWVPSWDGKKVVFAQKPNAADEATLYVLDVDRGERSAIDVIPGAKYASPSWTPDSKGFFYERLPTDAAIPVSERPGYTELRFHALGTPPARDALVFPRTNNPKTFLGGNVTRDGKWLFAYVQRGWNENDIYFQKLAKPDAFKAPAVPEGVTDTSAWLLEQAAKPPGKAPALNGWQLLVHGVDATYGVDVWRDVFYVTTDEGAPNKRVFKVDPKRPERAAWKELIPEDKGLAVEGASIVGGHLLVTGLRKAASETGVYTLEGKKVRTVELPGLGTATAVVGNEDDDEAYYAFSSFVMPRQVFKTSVKTGKSALWAKVEVPADLSPYQVEQVSYPSRDGTPISMFVVAKKGLAKTGDHPTLLYGYGGFDVSLTSSFTSFIIPWLEAGGVYAVPNLRGGGEYGKAWHDAGKGAVKQNVFDDFAAAAEFLIREKITRADRLGIRGGSNGGLLVGAAMVQRPELFGAVLCAVPLLDMLRYPLFGSGKTWVPEYGDPEKEAEFKVLEAYSPYHHVKRGAAYPPLLMLSADHDDRVDPMHARKFVAQVRTSGSTRPAWLRIEENAGHGGSDQVKKSIESSADQVAFLMESLMPQARVAGTSGQ